jgi:hypothetical protein
MAESTNRSRRALAFVIVVVAATVTGAIGVPWYAKKRLVEEAKAHGMNLAVADVSVGLGRARATKIDATFDAVPGAKLTAQDMTIELDGFTPKTLELHAPILEGEGSLDDARSALAKTSASTPLVIKITNGTVRWKKAWGESANLDVDALAGRTTLGGTDDDLHGDVKVTLRTLQFGTYKTTFVRNAATTTLHVAAPTGPAFAELVLGEGTRDLTINVPKTKAADLGIPSAALGLVASDDAQADLHLDHHEKNGATEGHFAFAADRIYLGHSPSPTSVTADVRYAGKGDKWPVTGGTIQAGPFRGDVSGSVERTPETILLHLESTTQAMSCADAVKSATSQAVGSDLAGAAGAFAQLFGMDKAVSGDVKLVAKVEADARKLAQATLAFHTEGACTLSFLPAAPAPP